MIKVHTGDDSIELDAQPEHVTIEKAKLVVRNNKGHTIAQFRKWDHWHETP